MPILFKKNPVGCKPIHAPDEDCDAFKTERRNFDRECSERSSPKKMAKKYGNNMCSRIQFY